MAICYTLSAGNWLENEWPWMAIWRQNPFSAPSASNSWIRAFECQKIIEPLRFRGVLFCALHDQLAILGRHAQLTCCFSAVAELLVLHVTGISTTSITSSWRFKYLRGERPYCYFRLSVVVEITVFSRFSKVQWRRQESEVGAKLRGSGERKSSPSPEFFKTFALKMVHSGTFWKASLTMSRIHAIRPQTLLL